MWAAGRAVQQHARQLDRKRVAAAVSKVAAGVLVEILEQRALAIAGGVAVAVVAGSGRQVNAQASAAVAHHTSLNAVVRAHVGRDLARRLQGGVWVFLLAC